MKHRSFDAPYLNDDRRIDGARYALAMSEENMEVVRDWWDGFNEHGMPSLQLCDEQIEI